jgi:GT2 family glycosyltransferase/glycosyltransferase involved in cell wall biosynthesis
VSAHFILRVAGRGYATVKRWLVPGLATCFDPAWYRDRYPDVQRSGFDPLTHYLLYGAHEGREPGPPFDSRYYATRNPDVVASGANPLLHFLRFGWKEGRKPNPLFDADFYKTNHPDLQGNPFVDYVARLRQGEKPQGWLPFTLPHECYQVATEPVAGKTPVDIVIPVYSGLEETRRCLESLLSSACQTPCEIVLINDQGPDPALHHYLKDTAEAHGLTLLQNEANLGFSASVNRGMALHPDRDVVLLNNDTEVADGWMDRLAAAAVGRTGTVTPFSNNATICTYPMPAGATLQELAIAFSQVNATYQVAIPTAVGFCMYIRRDCIKDVGEFRADLFGKGYGEENDFCLRATYKGWNHVLAADVFVYHAGETSFGPEAEALRQAGVATVNRLHPGYDRLIAEHMRRDPAKPYRVAVSAWRMRHSGKPVILSISHDLGGGIAQYVRELRERAEILSLTPTPSGIVHLPELDIAFDFDSDYPALLDLLRGCGVSRIHVQHLFGHTLDVGRLKHDLAVPLDFSIHDYFAICPQITLTDPAGRYCGEPDEPGCNACLAVRPPWPRLDIAGWRRKYGALVELADRVIAPSHDAGDRMKRYVPAAKIVVEPHASRQATKIDRPSRAPLTIAVLGAMNLHKGIHRFRTTAAEAKQRNLPLRFVLIGYVDQPVEGGEPFEQTGPYNNDELPGLVAKSGAHAVWFPAQWPETFSYTLSACLEMGVPVIAPNLGAFPERLAGRVQSWIVPWDWDAGKMLEFFLSLGLH